jgi:hypothetical protein
MFMLQTISIAIVLATQQLSPAAAFSPIVIRHAAAPATSTSLYLGDFFNNFGKDKSQETAPVAEESNQEIDEEYYDDDDPIEKIFGVFFGKKEKNP